MQTPGPGAGFTKPSRLTKAGLSDQRMHFVYTLVLQNNVLGLPDVLAEFCDTRFYYNVPPSAKTSRPVDRLL